MAAQAGTFVFVGTKSGQTYTVDVYIPECNMLMVNTGLCSRHTVDI